MKTADANLALLPTVCIENTQYILTEIVYKIFSVEVSLVFLIVIKSLALKHLQICDAASLKGVFRTLSKTYDEDFFVKSCLLFLRKISIIDMSQGLSYTSESRAFQITLFKFCFSNEGKLNQNN